MHLEDPGWCFLTATSYVVELRADVTDPASSTLWREEIERMQRDSEIRDWGSDISGSGLAGVGRGGWVCAVGPSRGVSGALGLLRAGSYTSRWVPEQTVKEE